jgi:FkbM family methyltransferase
LSLYRYGFCAPEARVCSALLRAGDVFVDGGANIGMFSLRAATIVGATGRVIACEPSPGTMDLLRANVERNGFSMADLHEVALSDEAGVTQFTVFEDGSGLASFAPQSNKGRLVDVHVATLDGLTSAFGDRVALVKLDIEGAEVKALRGASALILRAGPLFVVEVEPTHLARQSSSIDDLMAALRPYEYEAYAITPRARLIKLEGPWQPPDQSRPNLVLAPPSRSSRLQHLVGSI